MRLKLAIIGASYLQLPLVEHANMIGVKTICFAWEEGAVCKDICDEFYPISIIEKEKILKVCRELRIDGIVSIASDVAVMTVNYIADELNLIGNSIESSNLSTNKFLMRKAFRESNISIPKFFEVSENYKVEDLLILNYPLIIKPVDRSGSKGITVINSKYDLEKSIKYALNESFIKKAIVEEFIIGKEISVEVISWSGKHHILAFTDKITSGYPHFVELEHHQPSIYYSSELKYQIEDTVIKGLDSLKIMNGASHAEIIITDDKKIFVTEIGARMGGDFIGSDLVYLSTGFDFLKAVIEISLGSFQEPIIMRNKFCGVYFYSNKTQLVKAYEKDKCIIKSEFNKIKNIDLKQSSDRSGYLIYQSKKKLNIDYK